MARRTDRVSLPSVESVRGTNSGASFSKSGTNSGASKNAYGRTPLAVTVDPRLKDLDVRVYSFLAAAERDGRCSVGTRLIARSLRKSRRDVDLSLKRLHVSGHIGKSAVAGRRSEFVLLSEVFGPVAQRAERPAHNGKVAGSTPAGATIACGHCRKQCKRLPITGICRSCATVMRVAEILRANPAATEEEVYLRLRTASAKTIRTAIRKLRAA